MAAIEGRGGDRIPTLSWPDNLEGSDFEVRKSGEPFQTDKVRLVQIDNLFGESLAKGTNLATLLQSDLTEGEKALQSSADRVKSKIAEGLHHADGILYVLHGAEPSLSTPMQYGGHFLEVDRELLNDAGDLRAVFIVGGEGAFLEFVSDLPAEVFAWDVAGTGFTLDQMREMRHGALATTDTRSNIQLTHSGDISPKIQIQHLANV